MSATAKIVSLGRFTEGSVTSAALVIMATLPVCELMLRLGFKTGIPGSSNYVQNLTLWVGFLGAIVAARTKQHLTLIPTLDFLPQVWRRIGTVFSAAVSAAVAFGLSWAAVQFVHSETAAPARIAGWLPIWIMQAVLPLSFLAVAIRFIFQAGGWRARGFAALALPASVLIGFALAPYAANIFWPGLVTLIAAGLLGAPIFVVLAGTALLLFFAAGTPVASLPVEAYRLVVSPSLPTIPLFTLTGLILAEGGASRRLLRLFRALFGWMPGGLPIVATLLCAFFTTFTGASGVTILALGGLLLPVLLQSGYHERFSVGLLTATGSIGILFPPSLPVILYGVSAHVPIPDLFKASIVPGLLLVLAVCLLGIAEGFKSKLPRRPFDPHEMAAALWESKWEILLPVITLVAIFGGFCTLTEAAAVTVVYALVIETAVYRDLHFAHDLPRVFATCTTMMGGVFIILGSAMGLTNYLIDAEVPMMATAWVQSHIESRLVFLLVLNLFLLIVGCLMDIYSAIIVQAPLLIPVSQAFGIDPIHLGVIFLANLELGYLTLPVGLNLFLASYRFEKPVTRVFRDTLPFLLWLLLVVLLITYVPALTVGVANALKTP
ncbi:MAG TPA: TRAP transporter large permease subunit [Candidatus Binatia bacterium]|nr:TRAP transporter large permease subunit [Candidatus Binatia bacterium]